MRDIIAGVIASLLAVGGLLLGKRLGAKRKTEEYDRAAQAAVEHLRSIDAQAKKAADAKKHIAELRARRVLGRVPTDAELAEFLGEA